MPLAAITPEQPVFRIGRQPDPWDWPDWRLAGPRGTFGNRWDDPQGQYRVLYACSTRLGTFLETLARFPGGAAAGSRLCRHQGRS
ncbi:MAG: RES domain-containing protein [Candidatus Dormibacteria bacterium]